MDHLQSNPLWIEVAKYEELPENTGKTVHFKDQEIALFRLKNGKCFALENRSPHKNGVLAEGIVSGEYVFCPLYDRKIDLTTGSVQQPDTGHVQTFGILVEHGIVYVSLLEKNEVAS